MTRTRVDLPLLFAVLFLIALGVVMVYSSSWVVAEDRFGDSLHYLKRQSMYAVAGVFALMFGALIDPAFWAKRIYPWLGFCFFLLLIVLIPGVGAAAGIARRWIALGPLTLQAGEPLKFFLVVYLAHSMAKKGAKMRSFSVGLAPHLIIPGAAVILLLAEPDFGTALMLATLTAMMLFVGGARVSYLLAGVMAIVPISLYLVMSSAYRMRRIIAFLDPWAHRYDVGYQITESLMTLGSGGASGIGLGDGRQKLFYLPAGHTDFILANIGEELGFFGVSCVALAFLVILARGAKAAFAHTDAYCSYLALGLTAILVVQAAFNVAVVLGVVPTKGLTLPFLSYGGSSLVTSAFLAGVLLRVCGDAAPVYERRSARSTPPTEGALA